MTGQHLAHQFDLAVDAGNGQSGLAAAVGIDAGAGAHGDLAHVGHVEQAGGGAGVQVFLHHAGRVLHRHLVAGERHHAGAERQVQRVKRGFLEFRRSVQKAPSSPWAPLLIGRRLINPGASAPFS
ncbi:hypothetical protein SDC9_199376 [bioreactor metagenome]|uniref:Uncharacterized protein n=1 Tax=bioreactor metagenome TaxID=1076179 RepID=A0A645IKD3_9ZZZZ